jgi:hypothetical protein
MPMLAGPSEAARFVVTSGEGRVLVAGLSSANVIFSIRSLYAGSGIEVIRGDKLPAETFDAANLERFAHQFGVRALVLEKTPLPQPWDDLTQTPTPNMRLERVVKQVSSDPHWRGSLLIYRFLDPSSHPDTLLTIPIASTVAKPSLHFESTECDCLTRASIPPGGQRTIAATPIYGKLSRWSLWLRAAQVSSEGISSAN